jgi:hypothetical protein
MVLLWHLARGLLVKLPSQLTEDCTPCLRRTHICCTLCAYCRRVPRRAAPRCCGAGAVRLPPQPPASRAGPVAAGGAGHERRGAGRQPCAQPVVGAGERGVGEDGGMGAAHSSLAGYSCAESPCCTCVQLQQA